MESRRGKRPTIANTLLKKHRELTLPDFKIHYKSIVLQHGIGERKQIDQWIREPRNRPTKVQSTEL
jgi:hypothetical protein